MYKEYFGFRELPFSIAPDPRYLYLSEKHSEALAHLLYGVSSDGCFVVLTGEVGAGKTTVCRRLLEQMPANCDIAFILNPRLSAEELLAAICDELRIAYPEGTGSIKVFVDLINSYLLRAHGMGRKTVLIIEEAQGLNTRLLEQIRLLTNLETNRQKLLQIIMLGQPELRDMLARPEMRQLSQRITARYHLGPLSREEIPSYVSHRLQVAGVNVSMFSSSAMQRMYRLSRGIPRLINLLSDRALLGAYAQGKGTVDRSILLKASREIFGDYGPAIRKNRTLRWLSACLIFAFCAGGFAAAYYTRAPAFRATERVRLVVPPTLEWPANLPPEQSHAQAYEALFLQWGIPYDRAIDQCRQVSTYGLDCFEGSGSLDKLLQINRPAILKLFDAKGREYYVTLTSLEGRRATAVVGKETRNVDVKEIEAHWLGDYRLIRDTPVEYTGSIRPAAEGTEVQALDKQLALIQGREISKRSTFVYDDVLVRQVRQFQKSSRLPSDGIVGPRTIIALNAGAAGAGPKLTHVQEER